jgi:hypothetical protein
MPNPMTKKSSELPLLYLDGDSVKIRRHLRMVTALLQIADPKVEQALLIVLERLAAAAQTSGKPRPPSPGRGARRRRKLPQAS